MSDVNAFDGDGHVEEWEETFSDRYLEPAFRDRRPKVMETDEFERDFIWEIDGERVRVGGSPSSRGGNVSTEYELMAKWRGPHESGEFHSAKDRLAIMDAEDTWLSVNYPTLFLQWPVAKDPALNQALTRSYNNWIADISEQSPERLKWVTVIDAFDGKEAAREMERTKKMGSVGVMVLGNYEEKSLDHPEFTPIWEAANALDMPINVHPGFGVLNAAKDYPSLTGDQFLQSVVQGFETICVSGLLDRYPNVRVSFLETGCTWVDYAIEVIEFKIENLKERIKVGALRPHHQEIVDRGLPKMTPLEYIQAGRIFIGFEVDDDLLPYMVEKYGTDCWVYASDIPHGHRKVNSPRIVLDRGDLPEPIKQHILREGTVRLYDLS